VGAAKRVESYSKLAIRRSKLEYDFDCILGVHGEHARQGNEGIKVLTSVTTFSMLSKLWLDRSVLIAPREAVNSPRKSVRLEDEIWRSTSSLNLASVRSMSWASWMSVGERASGAGEDKTTIAGINIAPVKNLKNCILMDCLRIELKTLEALKWMIVMRLKECSKWNTKAPLNILFLPST